MSKTRTLSLHDKRKQQEKRRLRHTLITALCLVLAVVLTVSAVLVGRYTGLWLRTTTGASTTNRTVDKAMLTVYASQYLSDYVRERLYYIQNGYLSLDLDTPLREQTYDGTNSWYAFFAEETAALVRRDMLLCELAAQAGVTLTAEDLVGIGDTSDPGAYGTGINESDLRRCLEQQALAEKYLRHIAASLYGTEVDWEALYAANEDTYITVDYLYIDIRPTITSATQQQAYDDLINRAKTCGDPAVFKDTVRQLLIDHAGYTAAQADAALAALAKTGQTAAQDDGLSDWLFADDTAPYATYADKTTSSCKLYMLTRQAGRDTAATVTYRNILLPAGEEAKALADQLLAAWQADGATAEAFSAIAMAHSKDAVSLQTGGVYENVYNGRMSDPVNAWLFDSARQTGDTAVLETADGYQVLYYEGTGVERWQLRVREDLYDRRYTALLDEAAETYAYSLDSRVLDSLEPKLVLD